MSSRSSGKRTSFRVVGLLLALTCTATTQAQPNAPSNPSASAASTLPELAGGPHSAAQLFKQLAALDGLEATFVETKKLALLRAPLKSTGSLYYMRPGYLLREIKSPSPSRVLITPTSLELQDDKTRRSVDLRARPDVKLFVESFTKVLAGDQAALAKGFDIRFERHHKTGENPPAVNPPAEWTLELVPKKAPLNQLIKRLELTGGGYAVERVRVVETKGDSSEIVLTVKSIDRTYSPEEKARLFGLKETAPSPHP